MAESFLTLRTNGEHYALAADVVSEVIALPPVARVPQAPRGLLGLANLRGAVLPVALREQPAREVQARRAEGHPPRGVGGAGPRPGRRTGLVRGAPHI